MLFFRIFSLLCLCCFVTGCGFHPLYMPIQGSSRVAVPIKIATIQERDGQILRNYLVDLLTPAGAPQYPQYILQVSLTDVISDLGVNRDETASRKNATVTAQLTLIDARTFAIVYTHTTKAINSFAVISQNYFSDLTSEEYAKKEALRLLAEKITLLLTTFIDSRNEKPLEYERTPVEPEIPETRESMDFLEPDMNPTSVETED
jgi:LPS-assembly lipoprotein